MHTFLIVTGFVAITIMGLCGACRLDRYEADLERRRKDSAGGEGEGVKSKIGTGADAVSYVDGDPPVPVVVAQSTDAKRGVRGAGVLPAPHRSGRKL